MGAKKTKYVPATSWKVEQERSSKYKPKTKGQEVYWDALTNKKVILCDGPAGTGKTLLACAAAAQALIEGTVEKIVICRPLVATEEMGFMPGDINEKTSPYLQHIILFLKQMLPNERVDDFIKGGKVTFCPLAFMRGATYHKTFVILDEAQNATYSQLKLFLTRMGEGSVFVLNGDTEQSDIWNSGFDEALERMEKVKNDPEIEVVYLGIDDIVRSALLRKIDKILFKKMTSASPSYHPRNK